MIPAIARAIASPLTTVFMAFTCFHHFLFRPDLGNHSLAIHRVFALELSFVATLGFSFVATLFVATSSATSE